MSRRTIIILALGVIAAGGLGIAGYYSYQGRHYVSTDDARVAADLVSISPQLTGSILSWIPMAEPYPRSFCPKAC